MFRLGSRIMALTIAWSLISRFSKSIKNEDFFLTIGPLKLPAYCLDWYGGRVNAYGFRELNTLLLYPNDAEPRNLSLPGFVRISMRPNPKRSYSAEKGFELMRISRIDDRGGKRPLLNPSIKICPPLGPADGPAKACNAAARSSGSSGRASMSEPFKTTAPALFSGSVLNEGLSLETVTFCSSIATFKVMSN